MAVTTRSSVGASVDGVLAGGDHIAGGKDLTVIVFEGGKTVA